MNNREKLMDMMAQYELDRRDIAELARVKRDIVDHWLAPHESKHREEIPDMAIELLELKLKQRT